MRSEKDRRFFAIILGIILIVLIVLSVKLKEKKIDETNKIEEALRGNLDNDNLLIRAIDNDSYMVEGSGELSKSDMSLLLSSIQVESIDVVNLIIGDEITKITYNTINGFKYLETLKLGNGIKVVQNGAVRNNPNLKYVYVPAKIQKLPRDFLNGCGDCYLVSSGEDICLPETVDIDSSRIITKVTTAEDLSEAIKLRKKLVAMFNSKQLSSTDPESGTEPIKLRPGYLQYGPYNTLSRGDYLVRVEGENLGNLSSDSIYILYAAFDDEVKAKELRIDDSIIEYNISTQKDLSSLELGVKNTTQEIIYINGLKIFDNREVILTDPLIRWFQE